MQSATPNSVCCVHCVNTGSMAVVERCGKYDRVAGPGAQFVCWRASSLAQRRPSPPSVSIAPVHSRKHDAAVQARLGSLKFAHLHANMMLWPAYPRSVRVDASRPLDKGDSAGCRDAYQDLRQRDVNAENVCSIPCSERGGEMCTKGRRMLDHPASYPRRPNACAVHYLSP
eukprot:SAG31_NODE_1333_length_8743_cov_1.681050_6_plen_171_part_00